MSYELQRFTTLFLYIQCMWYIMGFWCQLPVPASHWTGEVSHPGRSRFCCFSSVSYLLFLFRVIVQGTDLFLVLESVLLFSDSLGVFIGKCSNKTLKPSLYNSIANFASSDKIQLLQGNCAVGWVCVCVSPFLWAWVPSVGQPPALVAVTGNKRVIAPGWVTRVPLGHHTHGDELVALCGICHRAGR